MSQQRSCCCGPQQEFELECLHSDKMSHHPSLYNRNDVTAHGEPRPGGGQSIAHKYRNFSKKSSILDTTVQLDAFRQGEGPNIDTVENSGMGCLLCQGSMIMTFQARAWDSGGMITGGEICPDPSQYCDSFMTFYDGSNNFYPQEEKMNVLYLAAKDFWFFERGPTGIPFSSFNFTVPPQKAPFFRDGDYPWTANDRLGKRVSPFPASIYDCVLQRPHVPQPTDNDGLCHPELTACTNPLNVVFGPDEGAPPSRQHIKKAYNTGNECGDENRDPEFAYYSAISCANFQQDNFVCPSVSSNINPWTQYGIFNGPCGGEYAPGFSSWQMYQMRKTPHLRYAADVISYGNGIRMFPAPGEVISDGTTDQDQPENLALFSNGYGGLYGTLFKVRMWVKADQHVNTAYEYPCMDSENNHYAYYPPETNRRMQTSLSSGGYRIDQKVCASGPATILYACSGVPVFSSDVKEIFNEGKLTSTQVEILNDYYYGRLDPNNPAPFAHYVNAGQRKHFECATFAGSDIEDGLGNTGRFVAKDWRPDQIQKYDELESEFRSKAAETIAELGENLPQDVLEALTTYTTIELPDSIKTYLKDGNELLPVQKSGKEFLSMFIHRVAPKQLGRDEGESTLITEMAHFQASAFDGAKFEIDSYDPWHPENTGAWPALGKERDIFTPIQLRSPDGIDRPGAEIFNFRYPVRAAYASAFAGVGQELTDEIWDEIAPKWERDLFEIWYKKNPVYFHAVPGGWMWSGDGVLQQPGQTCPPGVPCPDTTTDVCRWSNTLKKTGLIDSVHQLQFYDSPLASSYGCDSFPNWTRFISLAAGVSVPSTTLQLRNKPYIKRCSELPDACVFPGVLFRNEGVSPCDDGVKCSFSSSAGRPPVGNVCDESQFDKQCLEYGLQPDPTIRKKNCCGVRAFYAGDKKQTKVVGNGTTGIANRSPKTINENSTQKEKVNWNKQNPSVMLMDPSFYGIRCTERGNCPEGYQCCCPSGCDDDCFCIPAGAECANSPCSSANNFNSNCCAAYGSCCYTDSDGRLRCVDNVSNEECVARKELGGLNGTFYKDTTCSSGPCKTTVTTGACFYTDKLLDHQICRQTTQDTCTALSGEFFANQECSEFNDKITTGYETITSQVNNKPPYPGDRSCGRFGFSVNCCTEIKDEKTGVVTRTCEPKCIADCDVGENGTARIVSDCTSCAELGHCCDGDGYCDSRVTKENCKNGTWFSGEECDAESCITPFRAGPDPGTGEGCEDECPEGQVCQNGTCVPNPTKACVNDKNCPVGFICVNGQCVVDDGGGGGGDGDGGACTTCPPMDGPLATACYGGLVASAAGHYNPLPPTGNGPEGCAISKKSEAMVDCVTRHIQVTKMGFRHVVFSSASNLRSTCPVSGRCQGVPGRPNRCCAAAANPAYCYAERDGCGSGGWDDQEDLEPKHRAYSTSIVSFYPFKVRCQQVLSEAGFWQCQELTQYLFPEEITDIAVGIAGFNDYRTCHNSYLAYKGGKACDLSPEFCTYAEEEDCDGNGSTEFKENYSTNGGQDCFDIESIFLGADRINGAAFCPNLTTSKKRAFSIPFRNNETDGDTQHLYAPSYGVGDIPDLHCLSNGAERPIDTIPSSLPDDNILHECAEYYNDKILSDLDEYYEDPLPVTELTFTDYSGLGEKEIAANVCPADLESGGLANYFKNAKAEYVDAQFGGKANPGDFWVKKQFPELGYIRLFSVGCWNFPGTHEGGLANELSGPDGTVRAGGEFAGTMVMSFNSKEELDRYDAVYGSENLKLKFVTPVAGQPTAFPIGGEGRNYTFVAQPSYNIRIEGDFEACFSEDDPSQECAYVPDDSGSSNGEAVQACSYGQTGYLNGRGLKHASVPDGTDVNDPNGDGYDPDQPSTVGYWGKVYEFCSFIAPNANPPQLESPFTVGDHNNDSGGQLKPVFILDDGLGNSDPIPKFSGVRGPLVLLGTENFTVDLSRFDDVIENPFCGTCYTESGNLAIGYCVDVDGNRTTAETRFECDGIPVEEGGGDGDGDDTDPGGSTGRLAGGNGNTWFPVAPSDFTEELCLAPSLGGAPTSSYTWYPSVEGITNGGALGCCQHTRQRPGATEIPPGFDCSSVPEGEPCLPYSPCSEWQTGIGEGDIHNNPARTYGAGECWCDETG